MNQSLTYDDYHLFNSWINRTFEQMGLVNYLVIQY